MRAITAKTTPLPTVEPDRSSSIHARAIYLIMLLLAASLLTACGDRTEGNDEQSGRILLWHAWSGPEEEALNSLLAKFSDIYPEITVISARYTLDELKAEYMGKVVQGLGPDLLIGAQEWTPELVEAGLIRALNEAQVDTSIYLTSALNTVRYDDRVHGAQLYGLPLSVKTSALYYNRKLVSAPPETLQALLEEAAAGKKVALNTNFSAAVWGIQAFGGQLLDEEGRIVLNQGGLANWLSWLLEAQNVPNIILSSDADVLDELFAKGEAAYYVANSSELLRLQELLGEDVIGVAPLPAGPNYAAGPFLESEPIFFSTASSPRQALHALRLAEFLTNLEQQRKLAQLAGRVPANPHARIDRRVASAVAGFVEQSKTAVPLLLLPQMADAITLGEEAYVQALEGLKTPVEVAAALTQEVNDKYGIDTRELVETVDCQAGVGRVNIWHAWPQAESDALTQLGALFQERCPGTWITLTALPAAELVASYEEAVRSGEGPDLLLVSSEFSTQLASAELVADLSELVAPGFLQRYIPSVPDTLRYQSDLYGLPVTLDTLALYYNASMVTEPPVDLGDLLGQSRPDRQVALPYAPYAKAHWGLSAFGGRLFDADGNLILNNQGFAEWLGWLKMAQEYPGVVFTHEPGAAEALFASGQAAFFAGERSALNRLQAALGKENVRVAPLPNGPEGSSGPILEVDGFMLSPLTDQNRAALAIEFAKYIASAESQTLLMAQANLVPANIHVASIDDHPAIAGFLDQAHTAVILPNRQETTTILGLGSTVYENVLENGADPLAVLDDFAMFVAEVHGVASGENVAAICDDQGNLLVWHSAQGAEANVLAQIVADFARECPDIKVDLAYVAADDLTDQLAANATVANADDADQPTAPTDTDEPVQDIVSDTTGAPDIFLAPHDLVAPLSEERLIRPITPWVAGATLIPYQPHAVRALRYEDALYGLPFKMETMALYYNKELVEAATRVAETAAAELAAADTPGAETAAADTKSVGTGVVSPTASISDTVAENTLSSDSTVSESITSLYDLFAAATPATPLALDTSFEGAFWGALAFGRNVFEESGSDAEATALRLEQTGLVGWLAWLQATHNRAGIVMSQDQQKLREIFAAGNAAYLVAPTSALPSLRLELDTVDANAANSDAGDAEQSKVGVMLLPEGPAGQSTPFFKVSGFLFSAAASETQTRLALKFAEFASAGDSQAMLMRETQLIPANALAQTVVDDVAIDTFITQTETALLLPPRPENQVLFEGGNALYANVLEHERDPSAAMLDFTTYISETPRPELIAYTGDTVLACQGDGAGSDQLIFWHSWPFAAPDAVAVDAETGQTAQNDDSATAGGPSEDDSVATASDGVTQTSSLTVTGQITEQVNVLEQIITDFANHCPDVEIRAEYVPMEDVAARLTAAIADRLAPDLFIGPHDLIQPLSEEGLIRPVTELVDETLLASYLPKATASVEHEGNLYGLPQSMDVMALYYNTELVKNTVSTLDELLAMASPDAPVVLDASFYGAFWGVPAFGGKLFDTDGTLVLDQGGFLAWLTWLYDAQNNAGIILTDDKDEMIQRFAAGKAAYLVAGPDALAPLRAALGNKVRVIPLPVGPQGQAGPFLRVNSFLFSSAVSDAQTRLALTFAGFVSSAVNQQLLQQEANLIPTNREAAATVEDSAIKSFIRQVDESAIVMPNAPEMAILQSGNSIYVDMVIEGLDPATAVRRLMDAVADGTR